jgi:hypothetical protein
VLGEGWLLRPTVANHTFQLTMAILENPVAAARLFSKKLRGRDLLRFSEKSFFINS